MYALRVRGEPDKKLFKLAKKDPQKLKIINNKVQEDIEEPTAV